MIKNFPMTSAPNTQSYPEMGFPASAYYGIDASLQEQRAFTASGSQQSGLTAIQNGATPRTLVVVVLIVLGAGLLWHFYYRK